MLVVSGFRHVLLMRVIRRRRRRVCVCVCVCVCVYGGLKNAGPTQTKRRNLNDFDALQQRYEQQQEDWIQEISDCSGARRAFTARSAYLTKRPLNSEK